MTVRKMKFHKMGFRKAWFPMISKFLFRLLDIAGVIALVGILVAMVLYLVVF